MAAASGTKGADRFRAYLAYPSDGVDRLQGEQSPRRFLDYSRQTTAFPNVYDGPLHLIGPLASFSCDEDWVDYPYQDGVVLIGDAAATSDPAYGQGVSLTLRHLRTLSEELLSDSRWDVAGNEDRLRNTVIIFPSSTLPAAGYDRCFRSRDPQPISGAPQLCP